MGGDEILRPRAAELLRYLFDRRAIAWPEAGVDRELGVLADDEADIGNERDAVVRNDLDVGGDLAQPLGLDDRRRRRRLAQEMLRHERGESDRGGDRRECHAHDVLPSVIPAWFAVEGAEAP